MTTCMSRVFRRTLAFTLAGLLALGGVGTFGLMPAANAAKTPTLTATKMPSGGGVITITGTGFSASAPGIYLGVGEPGLGGFYAGAMRPQGSAFTTERTVYVAVGNKEGNTERGRTSPMNADGSFSVKVSVPADGKWAVYTSKAQGQGISDSSQNATLVLEREVAKPKPTETPSPQPPTSDPAKPSPVPSTPPTTSPTPSKPAGPRLESSTIPFKGGKVTVTGTGFDPRKPGIYLGWGEPGLSGFYQGVSEGKLSSERSIYIAVGNADTSSTRGRMAPMNADGSFQVSFEVPVEGNWAIYTSKAQGQGVADPGQNAYLELKRATEGKPAEPSPSISPDPKPSPSNPVPSTPSPNPFNSVPADNRGQSGEGTGKNTTGNTPSPTASQVCTVVKTTSGSLSWGVKSSFRNYVQGSIAKGSITTSGASTDGGNFVFAAANAQINEGTGLGTYSFSGSVNFTGHNGTLNLTIANPVIRQISATQAELLATVSSSNMEGQRTEYGRVTLANVSTAPSTVSNGSITVQGASATLAASGVGPFANFYNAGTALDPISFTTTLAGKEECRTVMVDKDGNIISDPNRDKNNLANTGIDDMSMFINGSLALIALGLVLLAVKRRSGAHR